MNINQYVVAGEKLEKFQKIPNQKVIFWGHKTIFMKKDSYS